MLDPAFEPAYAPSVQLPAGGLALRLGGKTPVSGLLRHPAGAYRPGMAPVVAHGRAAFCVANSAHFLGAVALVNSLRLTGWTDEIVIVDCGLDPEQRSLLEPETRILPAAGGPDPPQLVKVAGPLSYPTETAVVLDADMIVTRPIEPLVAEVEQSGRMIAVADRLADRFDERWGELLGLGELRRHRYVNCGLLIVPDAVGERLFRQWEDAQAHIDLGRSLLGGGTPSDPLFFADQDVLNAVLASARFAEDELTVLDFGAAPHPPFAGLRIVDAQRLRVAGDDGGEPFVLHHIQRKPWLEPLAPSVYSGLLPRLWLADDLPVRLPPSRVPRWFRPGPAGRVGAARAGIVVATERGRRAVRNLRAGASPSETEGIDILWQRVEALGASTALVSDLRTHRLQCFEIRRRRRLGMPVPDELAQDELAAIAASETARALLADARAAYDGHMLLTKGYELALRYPEPWLRPFSDVDLLVDDSAAAQEALLAAGFVEVGDPEIFEDIHHLRPLWRPGSTLVIELHHALKWPDGSPVPSTDALLEQGVPSRSGVPGLLTLTDDLHALAVAAHSWAHVPLRRLLDLVDVAVLTGGRDRDELDRLARQLGIRRIWSTTIAAVDEVLRGGRRPTLAGLTWARHLTRARDRTVVESHLERLLSPLWAHPLPQALGEIAPRVLNEVQPALGEGWQDKAARAGRAARNAFVRRGEHDSQLGAAAHRRRRS